MKSLGGGVVLRITVAVIEVEVSVITLWGRKDEVKRDSSLAYPVRLRTKILNSS